jgi:thymidylate synthase ThyX
MIKTKINAKIVADSCDIRGNRITSVLVTIPRIVLAELNTHRMFSRNSASSRAIPFERMVKAVKDDPFIPIAWQKDHSGMQGTEYMEHGINDLIDNHLRARDAAVERATEANQRGLTKQLCNRYLEPFMWHTVLITSTEWENFFALRCPQYGLLTEEGLKHFRSQNDYFKAGGVISGTDINIEFLKINKSGAEIHIQAAAEAIYDAMNESTPMALKDGMWHIPFSDKLNNPEMGTAYGYLHGIKVATAMCARTSYTVVGNEKEMTYAKLIEIHDRMVSQVPFHASPFEHCARVMTEDEYYTNVRGKLMFRNQPHEIYGWCRNFRGFIQYRHIIETK